MNSLQAHKDRLAAAYMRGWDDAVVYKPKANPYSRADFRRWYVLGYDECNAGKRCRFIQPSTSPAKPTNGGCCRVCNNHAAVEHFCSSVLRTVGQHEARTGETPAEVRDRVAANVNAGLPAFHQL